MIQFVEFTDAGNGKQILFNINEITKIAEATIAEVGRGGSSEVSLITSTDGRTVVVAHNYYQVVKTIRRAAGEGI